MSDGSAEPAWDDLYARGSAVRRLPLYDEAMALARDTMHRVRANALTLAERLDSPNPLGSPLPPPIIDEIERRCGILPIAFRAFYEIVGELDFSPVFENDGLRVASASDIVDTQPRVFVGDCYVEIPDVRADAAMLFRGAPLYVAGRRLTFVRYLRHAFHRGGRVDFLPGSLAFSATDPDHARRDLTSDLLPI